MSSPDEKQETVAGNPAGGIVPADQPLPTPAYLRKLYWWAYEHPLAVKFWDHDFLINFILLGNYDRLGDAVLEEFPQPLDGRTLQISCAYGKLTPRLQKQLGANAQLDIIDVLQVQLDNTRRKLQQPDERITLTQCNAAALKCADASYDRALMFFLPHELPEPVRRIALAEAFRVIKPGGQLVLVEFHKPKWWHPLRLYQRLVFLLFEPFAVDLWQHDLTEYFPPELKYTVDKKATYFGDLYQKLVITRHA
ncbi:MAG: rhodoquinone biosynthesis methyltransferase RquA [Burkholderiaceae bacterium]|nr:rhodoquinone biosynthesis methyltransferase RquA [Burkholderiaceae bacterium]